MHLSIISERRVLKAPVVDDPGVFDDPDTVSGAEMLGNADAFGDPDVFNELDWLVDLVMALAFNDIILVSTSSRASASSLNEATSFGAPLTALMYLYIVETTLKPRETKPVTAEAISRPDMISSEGEPELV
jgi:hypothetical protein